MNKFVPYVLIKLKIAVLFHVAIYIVGTALLRVYHMSQNVPIVDINANKNP